MSKVSHPPPTTPGQTEVFADFASKLPYIDWNVGGIYAKHVDIEGTAHDVFALQCTSNDGAGGRAALRIQLSLPCSRPACFCDYSRKPEIPENEDQVVSGSMGLTVERR